MTQFLHLFELKNYFNKLAGNLQGNKNNNSTKSLIDDAYLLKNEEVIGGLRQGIDPGIVVEGTYRENN